MVEVTQARIESEIEVKAYIQNLQYALNNGAIIKFQQERLVDRQRNPEHTNLYTVTKLFPGERPVDALRRELLKLTVEDYMSTVKDIKFPEKPEMRTFGKVYDGEGDVYIKLRVELINDFGSTTTFVMSFHFAETPLTPDLFPYKKGEN